MSNVAAGGLRTDRIQTLVDGVFAVAMTLLVLDIHVPSLKNAHGQQSLTLLVRDLPWGHMLLYAISFVIVGVYWVGHHNQYAYIKRSDRQLLWINILFALCVAFIPFSTALIGQYYTQRLAITVYGVNLIATGLALYLHWWYATSNGRLTGGMIDPHIVSLATRRILMAPVAYVVAIALSLVMPTTIPSLVIYALVPLLYILPGNIDRHFLHHAHTGEEIAHAEQPRHVSGESG